MRVVLRCDASPAIGFGHLFRTLALACEFRDRGADVSFAMRENRDAFSRVTQQGYSIVSPEPTGFDALILDVRQGVQRSWIDALRTQGVLVATIDDPTDYRLSADLAFYPPIPQVEELDWHGFTGKRVAGGQWVVLRRAFAEAPVRHPRPRPNVLVTMGGSDPAGMTLTVLNAIALMDEAFDVSVVLGPGYQDRRAVDDRLLRFIRTAIVLEEPADMRAVMLDADVAVASFGVTAYELAATATPAIHLCLTEDHKRSAGALEDAGASVVVGVHTGNEAPQVADALRTLLADPQRRAAMGRAGRALIDGRGAGRVADRIIEEFEARRT